MTPRTPKPKVDVRTMKLLTDPKWTPVTTYSVNLVHVGGHTHGNHRFYKGEGQTFVAFDDAVVLMARVLEHHGLRP